MRVLNSNKLYNNILDIRGCQVPAGEAESGLAGAFSLAEATEVWLSALSGSLRGGSPLSCIRSYETRNGDLLAREQKAKRFYVKCLNGILVALERDYRVRIFTLTESDYALGMGLDFGKCVQGFEHKLRHDYGRDVGFVWVEHLQGDKQRLNRHFIEWGRQKLDAVELDNYWRMKYGSFLSRMTEVKSGGDAEKVARYLARYVAGEGFVKARFSYNWVFPRWFDFGKWVKREFGYYPSVSELAELSGMSPTERVGESIFGLWLESESRKPERVLVGRSHGLTPWKERRRLIYEYGKHHLKSSEYVD